MNSEPLQYIAIPCGSIDETADAMASLAMNTGREIVCDFNGIKLRVKPDRNFSESNHYRQLVINQWEKGQAGRTNDKRKTPFSSWTLIAPDLFCFAICLCFVIWTLIEVVQVRRQQAADMQEIRARLFASEPRLEIKRQPPITNYSTAPYTDGEMAARWSNGLLRFGYKPETIEAMERDIQAGTPLNVMSNKYIK